MADSFIQLPADSTGKQLDTALVNMGVGTTAVHREKVVVADPLSTSAFAVVTSSQGLQVSSTQAQTISGTVTVLSASSGLVQISGTPTVTATAGTNPWSSAPGFNVPVVSVSSGLVQTLSSGAVLLSTAGITQVYNVSTAGAVGPVTSSAGQLCNLSSGTVSLSSQITVTATGPVTITSGTVTLSSVHTIFSASSGGVQAFIPISPTSSIAGAGFGPVTSSAGVLATISSGTVSLSSQITVTATGPVTVTSGLISVTSGTITSTAATNPWSSAPGFNVPVVTVSSGLTQIAGTASIVSASSGLIQISGVPTVLSASSGFIQAWPAVTPTSSIAGASLGPVTSSAGVLASLTSGTVSLSSQITVTATGPVTVTSGTITATAATNPWSSSPGFNLPVVSVSSGLVQISGTATVLATAGTNPWSSAPGFNIPVVTVSSGLVQISGTPIVLNASSGLVQTFQTGTWTIQTTAGTAIATSSAIGLPGYAAVTPTSSVAGASIAPVTSSAGLLASLSSGTVTLSSAHVVSLSSGTVTLSSNPTVISASSGLVQISGTVTVLSASSGLVQISGVPTVTATAATNPWSSAPGFNLPTVSVSSGLSQVSAIQVSPTSSVAGAGLLVVTSSFGLVTQSTQPITITSGTVTISGTVTVLSASSGLVQISGTPTVTATAGTNPWSSAPGFNIPIVSVSSGLEQVFVQGSTGTLAIVTSSGALLVSGTPGSVSTAVNILGTQGAIVVTVTSGTFASALVVWSTSTSGGGAGSTSVNVIGSAGFAPVTSSAGLVTSLSSGTVSLSSQITVTATGPVTVTSGLISITSGTITSTSATNPWSSAPGFNIPTVSVSSGLDQISAIQVSPTSSVAGAGLLVITSSFGLLTQSTQPVTITSGTVSLSSQITVTATGPVTMTSGTMTLSSAPLVIVASSGGTQTVIMSSVQTVTATAATNPWSSAPGFNVPVVNVSSGFIRAFPVGSVTTSGLTAYHAMSTGGAVATNITTAPSAFYGYSIFNTSVTIQAVKFYNTTAPTVGGSTANLLLTVMAPGSTGGGGANLTFPIGIFSSNGFSHIFTANVNDTDTGAPGTNTVSVGVFYQT